MNVRTAQKNKTYRESTLLADLAGKGPSLPKLFLKVL